MLNLNPFDNENLGFRRKCLSIPIVSIILRNNYPIKGSSSQVYTIAKWRGGKKNNVSISIDKNIFYDFVTGDSGGPIELHCLITGEDLNSINYKDLYEKYTSKFDGTLIEKYSSFNKVEDIEKEKEVLEEVKNIYKLSKAINNDFYFVKKNIAINDNQLIKQLILSNFAMRGKSNKNNYFAKDEFKLLSLHGSIVIPAFNIDSGEIQTIQYLLNNKDSNVLKLFHLGSRVKDSYFPINFKPSDIKNHKNFILCEGVATGFSILKIINYLNWEHIKIICCFNSMNISNVLSKLCYDNVIIATDYDQINIINNDFENFNLSAGHKSVSEFNKENNVYATIASIQKQSKYYLKSIMDDCLTLNDDFIKEETDFNDIDYSSSLKNEGIDFSAKIFDDNFNYYSNVFNKKTTNSKLDYSTSFLSPFSYSGKLTNSQLDILNNIILENQFLFY